MTATIKPPTGRPPTRRRPVRFSSLESLGFSHAAFTWSDSPVDVAASPKGLHDAPRPEPVADRQPEEFGARLNGSNVRWGLVVSLILLAGSVASFGFWLYQRPAAIEQASLNELTTQVRSLDSAIPALTEFNQGLLDAAATNGTGALVEVEASARALFNASAEIGPAHADVRAASSRAAGSALDAIRVVREAHSYRVAVLPVLVTPALETDPEVIALDAAALAFGNWQISFDNVRTALPDGVFPGVTENLDVLSGDLATFLSQYVEALRLNDQSAAEEVLSALESRLADAQASLTASLQDTQGRIEARVEETLGALEWLLRE